MKNSNFLKNNINYLLKSRKETQASLSEGAGINRTTIYNILEGRVERVQSSTLRKVAGFFGVSFEEIQTINLKDKEATDTLVSVDGNMNPVAVPIVDDTTIISSMNAKIGSMVVTSPLTYYFGQGPNIVAIRLTKSIKGYYEKGNVIIVQRGVNDSSCNLLVVSPGALLCVMEKNRNISLRYKLIGMILEERYDR